MSLIADALKRAQEQRAESKGGKTDDDKARRLLSGSGPLRVETRDGVSVPRSVGIAGGVLVAALVTFGGVVWLTPRSEIDTSPALGRELGAALDREPTGTGPAAAAVDTTEGIPIPTEVSLAALRNSGDAGFPGGAGTPAGSAEPDAGANRAAGSTTGDGAAAGADGAAGAGDRVAGSDAAGETGETPSFTLRIQGQAAPEPVDASELFGRAISAQQRGDLRGAASLYRRAIERNPTDAQLHNNLGTVYRALDMPGEALGAFRTAVDVDPSYAPAWSNLGIMLDGAGRTEEAIEAFREALRRDPSNNGARVNLANKYIGMGLVDEARELLRRVIRDSPALPEAHYAMARALEAAGETGEAVRHYRIFLDLSGGRFPALEERVRGHLSDLGGGGI